MDPQKLKENRNHHFYVLTGGPGVGKTSVLDYLKKKNYTCVKEVAREIIKKQLENGDEALPWKNKNLYKDLMLDLSVKDFIKASQQDKEITFFDRGIPDTLAYAYLEDLPVSKSLQFFAENYRYNTTVFIFPPWKEIYKTDHERRQSYNEVEKTHKIMMNTYQNCGYEPIIMPKTSIENRGDFILQRIFMEYE